MPKLRHTRIKGALAKRRFRPEPAVDAQREVTKPYHDDWWKQHQASRLEREIKRRELA